MNNNGTPANQVFCVPYEGAHFEGILAHLTKQAHRNPAEAGILKINAPAQIDPYMRKASILEPKNKGSFYNYSSGFPSAKENWIEFDFLDHKVEITAYSVKCCDRYILKEWDILGSNDGRSWSTIHTVRRGAGNIRNSTQVFRCAQRSHPFRFIRYVQRSNFELDPRVNYFVQIAAMEFFGKLIKS
jgi:hypothetical protein